MLNRVKVCSSRTLYFYLTQFKLYPLQPFQQHVTVELGNIRHGFLRLPVLAHLQPDLHVTRQLKTEIVKPIKLLKCWEANLATSLSWVTCYGLEPEIIKSLIVACERGQLVKRRTYLTVISVENGRPHGKELAQDGRVALLKRLHQAQEV